MVRLRVGTRVPDFELFALGVGPSCLSKEREEYGLIDPRQIDQLGVFRLTKPWDTLVVEMEGEGEILFLNLYPIPGPVPDL